MRTLFAIILLLSSTIIFAQFTDDFTDGDFTQNPVWTGDVDSFIVNTNLELQLNATDDGYSYLSTTSTQIDDTQWEFKLRLSFSPSANNNVSIFLVSDNVDVTQSLNGYFIKIGENLSDDGIDLFRKDGSTETKIIDGTAGTAASGGEFVIKVIRDNAGNWELYTDGNLEGTINDNAYTSTNYFGVYCKYTSSNATNFYFDDFYVGNIIVDTIAPTLDNIEIISQNQLKLTFSENLETTSASDVNNYVVDNGIGNPSSINFSQNIAELTFAQDFVSGQQNTITLSNIADLAGNTINNFDTSFTYVSINTNDIVINELMADPSPVVGLPAYEFIELYNSTNFELNLSGWYLIIGSTVKNLNDFTLSPNGYIIICDDGAEADFTPYGNVTVLSSLSLTNSGNTVALYDENDVLINTVSYTDSWYNDAGKEDGGWTLEKIDPLNNCSGSLNWTASIDTSGGTPGTQNSVYASNIDDTAPFVTGAVLSSNSSIEIELSETIVDTVITNLANYSVDGNTVASITLINPSKIDLILDNQFVNGSQVVLHVSNLDDYCGNVMNDTTIYLQTDTITPYLENLEILSQNQLKLTFSEELETTSANDINNYVVNNGIGNPTSINFTQNIAELTFSQNFTSGQENTITLNNIADLGGNTINNFDTTFTYVSISENNIVINELMVDPSPAVGLPDYEFIELYNTTPYTLNLSGWYLTIGTTVKNLNDFTLAPNGYIIICDDDAEAEFTPYGNVTVLSSLALTNSGNTVTLYDENDVLINTVSYIDSWYNDAGKEDGGWSLEKIDPANNCSGSLNWTASINTAGGTPGTQNSVYANNVDNTAPFVTNSILSSNNSIAIEFSEEIVNTSIINTSNYLVEGNIISNITVISPNKIDISVDNEFTNGSQVVLHISNLDDYCGNIMNDTIINFTYYKAKQFDIVINEIMADPTPAVYLPEAEYIELFNTSEYQISMHNWTLYYGNYSTTIPDINIPADSFIVICKDIDLPLFSNYNNVYPVPSFNLSANGMLLAITDEEGNTIHSVNYDISWYKDDNKTDGGWSLEQIDPTNPCGDYDNWHASTSNMGGTPSAINSVNEPNQDNNIPELVKAYILDTNTIIVTLSETIILDTINADIFSVDNSIGNAINLSSETADNKIIKLSFAANFEENITYTLSLISHIADCAGNLTDITKTVKFGFSTRPEPNTVIINEVLFNPLSDGVDYVELYNRSNDIIDVSELKIATKIDGVVDNIKIITIDPYLIFPKEYVLISKNSRIVKQQYTTKTKYNFIDVDVLPTYSNEEGTVVIVDNANIIIDDFEYNEDMHFPTLVSNDGVSLERINPNIATNLSTNWHSAAETVGFGTPGYVNSQYNPESNGTGTVSLEKDVFSPDNDGYEDILVVNYNMEKAGYTANVYIFDANGRLMKQIVNNELLAISGSFNWDGIDDYDQKVKIGTYILVFEVFDMEGNTNKYKLPFVVAGRIE